MTGRRIRAVLTALTLVAATPVIVAPALAVQPDEVLADPGLEARARSLSAGLRCMVCQNQSIDDSDAPLARDLRLIVRERLTAGDSDGDVIDYLVSRYGQFVLLRPRLEWETLALWGTPLALLLAGAGVAMAAARKRRPAEAGALTASEEATLARTLAEDR